jgi:ABC-type lipoprotein release transport system permease subunit
MMYLILSWRNLWRNKRRTLIVVASVFFAVIFSCIMRSGQLGSYAYMIDSSARLFTGHLQVQGEGYWENRSLDKSIRLTQKMINTIRHTKYITNYTLRLETFALVSEHNKTRVAQVTGISPGLEDSLTGLSQRVIAGHYLNHDSKGVIIGESLAKSLDLNVGDSLALLGQGYHGQTAAALVKIEGLVKLPFEEMNNRMLFMTLEQAQQILSAPDRITAMAMMVDNIRHLDKVCARVESMLDKNSVIMTWDEMMPDLVQNIQVDNASGLIMIAILYIVIGFGVFGTVMMMINERTREFGILISVGMKKLRLIIVSLLETLWISLLGVLTGVIGSIPVIYYLHFNPIYFSGEGSRIFESLGIEPVMMFGTDTIIFINQALVVLIIALTTAIYPVLFIRRLVPVEAIHK